MCPLQSRLYRMYPAGVINTVILMWLATDLLTSLVSIQDVHSINNSLNNIGLWNLFNRWKDAWSFYDRTCYHSSWVRFKYKAILWSGSSLEIIILLFVLSRWVVVPTLRQSSVSSKSSALTPVRKMMDPEPRRFPSLCASPVAQYNYRQILIGERLRWEFVHFGELRNKLDNCYSYSAIVWVCEGKKFF